MKKAYLILVAMVACAILSLYGDFDEALVFIDGTDSLFVVGDTTMIRTQVGGYLISSQDIVKACVIFVDVYNESTHRNEWPANQPPNFINQFINADPGAAFPNSNISKFYHSMSFGSNQVIGDAYYYSLPFNPGDIPDLSLNYLNTAVIQGMDSQIDYSVYDNWTRTSNYNFTHTRDGIVDMLIIIYKFSFSDYSQLNINFTAIARLPLNSQDNVMSTNDGVSLNYTSGITQGSGKLGYEYTKYVTFHEYAHYLLGDGHTGRIAELGILSGNQVAYSDSKGMCAYEKERLGWIAYTVVPDPLPNDPYYYPLPDYMTTGYALRIPTTIPTKYYVIENRQKIDNEFDKAWDAGIYIYLVNENGIRNSPHPINTQDTHYDGAVNLLSADGRYNFQNDSANFNNYDDFFNNLKIWKTEPNPNPIGYDERDYYGRKWFTWGSTRFYCYKLWYDGDWRTGNAHQLGDAWGDVNDAFSLSYNRVFSKWSNPGLDSSFVANFSIEVTQENYPYVTIAIRRSGPQNAPLARPMGLSGTSSNGISYELNWYQPNAELQPGFQSYELYHRRSTTSTWNLIASTTNQNISLSIPYVGNPNIIPIHKRNYFKVRAVKASPGDESNFSDEIIIVNNDIIIPYYSISSGKTLSIDDSLTVWVTGSLEMQQNSGLLLGRGSRLIVQEGASLVIGSNCQVKGTNKSIGTETGSAVVINGSVSVGTSVTFSSDIDSWDGLIIDSATQANLTGVSFNNADLVTYSDVTVEACTFSNGSIKQYAKDLTISSSTFNSASIKSVAKLEDSSIDIVSSQFYGSSNLDAIEISSMSKYAISGNYISGYRTALAIYESMNGSIEANEIVGNGTGVQLYHAVADIYNGNAIQNNDYGIVALRNSLWSLQGSQDAPYQFVNENGSCQVLFTYDSAPEYMEFNHIYSTNNSDKAFVVCDKVPSNPKKILIANNYFGTMFDPLKNLIPTEIFIYEPVWVPDPASANVSILPGMYKTAKDYQRTSDYDAAQALWYQYYSAVPDSSILYDKTVKQLLSVEKLTSDDYSQLLSFYGTTGTTSPISMHLLNYLSNYCLIEVNAFQPAILWLESQIENPVTDVDSLFAAIDIGYLYMLVDSSKAAVQGKLPWLKPTSVQAFESNRNNAIMSLINGQSNSQSSTQSVEPSTLLMSNYPNPFNPSTTISFNLPSVMNCKLEIYNLKGQRVTSLLNETRGAGKHTITWDGLDEAGRPVSSGIYFYRLTTPQRTISAKMLMIK